MTQINSHGLTVITIPQKMRKNIEKLKNLKKVVEKQNDLINTRKGKLSDPIILCKNEKLNFYKGQTYGKFNKVPLASENWKGRKSKGSSFSINKHSENPAFIGSEDDLPSFVDLGLDTRIVDQLKKVGYVTPTNIQRLAIPRILEGINSVISAETGNGKTMAFIAPIIDQVLKLKENNDFTQSSINSPKALIIVPGRELVSQTTEMARSVCDDLGVRVNMFYGGRTKRMMLNPRIIRPDILVGSFGALSKLMTNQIIKRNEVNHIVLDEADTLLDDSFNEKVTYFLSKFPKRNQVSGVPEVFSGAQLTLVGATFPRSLQSILKDIADVSELVQIKTPYLHRISPHINHHFIRTGTTERTERLMKVAKRNQKLNLPTIIFSNTSSCSNFVYHFLNDNGIPCINVNSDMTAFDRIGRFEAFQKGECNFISCTDLVSRGLNTVRAQHVVNFEFPRFISDYIHRCGRTGRTGNTEQCHVTSFVYHHSDVDLVQKLEYAVRKTHDLPNVNANIKRIINARLERKELNESKQAENEQANAAMEKVEKEFGTSEF